MEAEGKYGGKDEERAEEGVSQPCRVSCCVLATANSEGWWSDGRGSPEPLDESADGNRIIEVAGGGVNAARDSVQLTRPVDVGLQ